MKIFFFSPLYQCNEDVIENAVLWVYELYSPNSSSKINCSIISASQRLLQVRRAKSRSLNTLRAAARIFISLPPLCKRSIIVSHPGLINLSEALEPTKRSRTIPKSGRRLQSISRTSRSSTVNPKPWGVQSHEPHLLGKQAMTALHGGYRRSIVSAGIYRVVLHAEDVGMRSSTRLRG